MIASPKNPGGLCESARRAAGNKTFWEPAVRNAPLLLLLLGGALLCNGCARNYMLTLTNGSQLVAKSKPKLKQGFYFFKDAQGRPAYVPAGRVTLIEPSSMARSDQPDFTAEPSR